MASSVIGTLRIGFDAVFRPSGLVGSRGGPVTGSVGGRTRRAAVLVLVYVSNLFLYAVPLTYAGFGADDEVGEVPPVVGNAATWLGTEPESTWLYTIALAENCAFLFAASVLTLAAYHVAMVATLSSKGLLQSLQTVVYSTGIYLAAIFSFAWYLSISDRIEAADQWLIAVQVEFISLVVDSVGADLSVPGPRLADVDVATVTPIGQLVLASLVVSVLYYLYSLYLGARINHQSSRFVSLLAIGFVAATPVLYVVGLVVLATVFDLPAVL